MRKTRTKTLRTKMTMRTRTKTVTRMKTLIQAKQRQTLSASSNKLDSAIPILFACYLISYLHLGDTIPVLITAKPPNRPTIF